MATVVQSVFTALADHIQGALTGDEAFTCGFYSEHSDFIRLNHGKIRQAGNVEQRRLTLDLIDGRRHASGSLSLSGDAAMDCAAVDRLIAELRVIRASAPKDPHLLYSTDPQSSESIESNRLPPAAEMVDALIDAGTEKDFDLVGFFASGSACNGFANSLGQRNWQASFSFNADWSLHLEADKAVKARYAGFDWQPTELRQRMTTAAGQLERLRRPAKQIEPGRYRAYLTPGAVEEIFSLLSWGGFGLGAQRTGNSPLLRLIEGAERLNPAVTLTENIAAGAAPPFQNSGFIRPAELVLVEQGRHCNSLVSPRSAAEYDVACNGADADESPLALQMAAGDVPVSEALTLLDTGIFIGNLWYLNYSDRNTARITGMTRFACFWVENGQIQAPLGVMQFDESLFNLLGDNLLGITRERELLLDPGTYDNRSNRCMCLPGIVVQDMAFTL